VENGLVSMKRDAVKRVKRWGEEWLAPRVAASPRGRQATKKQKHLNNDSPKLFCHSDILRSSKRSSAGLCHKNLCCV
jgi:hypothetical protein